MLTDISNLTSSEVFGAKQGTGRQGVDPILVPKQIQHVAVQGGLEVGNV